MRPGPLSQYNEEFLEDTLPWKLVPHIQPAEHQDHEPERQRVHGETPHPRQHPVPGPGRLAHPHASELVQRVEHAPRVQANFRDSGTRTVEPSLDAEYLPWPNDLEGECFIARQALGLLDLTDNPELGHQF